MRGASKTFPGVRALSDFDLDVAAGSVHALLGHNGCGKSTLIKALAGVHAPDPGGRAWIDGEELWLGDAGSRCKTRLGPSAPPWRSCGPSPAGNRVAGC